MDLRLIQSQPVEPTSSQETQTPQQTASIQAPTTPTAEHQTVERLLRLFIRSLRKHTSSGARL
jgi:hypothetical protein